MRRIAALLALLSLSGCLIGPDYERPPPATPTTPEYKETSDSLFRPAQPRDTVDRGPWWNIYSDPTLDQLTAQVEVSNQNLKASEAAYRQAVALIRPGPASSGMKDAYVRRFRELERPTPPHPRLTELLWDTFGVMLYQEDVMQAASLVAGMELSEADLLRRALTKRRAHELGPLHERFLVGAEEQGIARADAERVWELISNFASFGFCKAHAVTYGRISWRAAWSRPGSSSSTASPDMRTRGTPSASPSSHTSTCMRWTSAATATAIPPRSTTPSRPSTTSRAWWISSPCPRSCSSGSPWAARRRSRRR